MQRGYYAIASDKDKVIYAGFSKESAMAYIDHFEKYLNENRDSIEALRILYNSEDLVITHTMLVELRDRLLAENKQYGIYHGNYSAVLPNEKEIALIQTLADFPSTVQEAGRDYSPAVIANYVYELVKQYNQFYHDYSILREEDAGVRSLRLALCEATSRVVKTGMGLLGIKVPERM